MKQICGGRCQHCQHFAKAKPSLHQLTKFLALVVIREKAGVGAIYQPSPKLVKLVNEPTKVRDIIVAREEFECRDDGYVLRNHAPQHRLIDSTCDLRILRNNDN